MFFKTGTQEGIIEAEYLNLFDLTALNAVVDNNPGAAARSWLGAGEGAPAAHEVKLETASWRSAQRAPGRPESGVWIEGYEADFVWPRAGLIVELDGLAAHKTRSTFNVIDCGTVDCGGRPSHYATTERCARRRGRRARRPT